MATEPVYLAEAEPFFGWETRVIIDGVEFVHNSLVSHKRGGEPGPGKRPIEVPIHFFLPFNLLSEAKIGLIRLHNLRNTSARLFEKGKILQLRAGWLPWNRFQILEMDLVIETVNFSERTPTRWTVDVRVGDASERLLTQMVSRTWPRCVRKSRVFRDLIDMLGLPVAIFRIARDGIYRRGKVFYHPLYHAIEELARDTGSLFWIYNREVHVIPPEVALLPSVLLAPGTGLIRVQRALQEEADGLPKIWPQPPDPAIYHVRSFLNPLLRPARHVQVRGKFLRGDFRVVRGAHYYMGERYSTVVWLAQAHELPATETPIRRFPPPRGSGERVRLGGREREWEREEMEASLGHIR